MESDRKIERGGGDGMDTQQEWYSINVYILYCVLCSTNQPTSIKTENGSKAFDWRYAVYTVYTLLSNFAILLDAICCSRNVRLVCNRFSC